MHLYRHDYMGDVILQIPGTSQKKIDNHSAVEPLPWSLRPSGAAASLGPSARAAAWALGTI